MSRSDSDESKAPDFAQAPVMAMHDESAHRVHLPGFLIDQEIGLGDLFKKITYSMGIRACGACESRAEALNRWVTLSR
jgi:hypothetical protein